jgi:hypothetical protein
MVDVDNLEENLGGYVELSLIIDNCREGYLE